MRIATKQPGSQVLFHGYEYVYYLMGIAGCDLTEATNPEKWVADQGLSLV